MNRRDLLKLTALGVGLGMMSLPTVSCAVTTQGRMLPPSKGKRIVIVGGGWAGVTAAKYLKREIPDADVVLIEKRKMFMSCPISNVWLAGLVNLDFLIHDYLTPAAKYGYTFINATVTGIDRDKRRVYTDQGYVEYDYLVLAPGIGYNYDAWFAGDKEMARYTQTHYPSAFIPGSEHLRLRKKVENFEGGTFVLVVPPAPYRCPPAPYERAAMIAYVFKKNKAKARLVVLDPKSDIAPKGPGFKKAFEELYLDIIEYVPMASIKEVDPVKKVIKTTAGDIKFDDANLNPPHQAASIAWEAGLVNPQTGWCDVDPLTLQSKVDPRVFVPGDANLIQGYPKSGDMANNQTKSVLVKAIKAMIEGKDPLQVVKAPTNTCYSMVNGDPQEAIVINVVFDFDMQKRAPVAKKTNVVNDRSTDLARATFEWAKGMYRDMFS